MRRGYLQVTLWVGSLLAMRWSWLSNPTFAILNLIATTIAIGQFLLSLAKRLDKLLRAESKRERIGRAVIFTCYVAIAILTPITWTTIVAIAQKSGNPGWQGFLYPLMLNGLSLIGTLALKMSVERKERFYFWPCFSIVFGLGSDSLFYTFGVTSTLERMGVNAIPGIAMVMIALGWIASARLSDDSKNKQTSTAT